MTQFDEDYEIEALARCTKALSQIDEKARIRVFKFLIDKFDLMQQSSEPIREEEINNQPSENSRLLSQPIENSSTVQKNQYNPKDDEPSFRIKDLILKGFTHGEQDITLLACYISSNFGENYFSRQSILDTLKEQEAYSRARVKNLSTFLINLTKRDHISSYNSSQYMITQLGIEECKNILDNNSSTKKRKTGVRKAKTNNTKNKETGIEVQETNED